MLEVNAAVVDGPETVNDDPYGAGWLVRIALADPAEPDGAARRRRLPRAARSAVSYTLAHRADREAMLAAIGVASVDELFADIPPGVRFDRQLDVPPALAEADLGAHLTELAGARTSVDELSFLGAGIYDHYVPAVVDAVLQRGEFLTAYTPYQPEMSQGVAAGDLRVPDGDLRADRDGRLQRLRLRRHDGRRRRLLRREGSDRARRGS